MLSRVIAVIGVIGAGGYIAHLHLVIDELERQLDAARVVAAAPAAAPVAAAPAAPAAPAAQAPAAEPAGEVEPPPAPAAESADARVLSPEERAAMVAALSNDGMNFGSPVWFSVAPNDAAAAEFQKTLQGVFEDAGWIVKETKTVGFSMKPGIYLFAAEEDAPDYVDAVASAFEKAGIALASNGRGYREYYEGRKAENPQWVGFEMDANQTFVLAIGRQPAS